MSSKTFVFFDLETTGLDIYGCNIIQISAICGDNIFDRYTVPMKPISPGARDLTGFTVYGSQLCRHGLLMQTIPLRDLLNQFINFLAPFNRPLLVAHNGKAFDAPVLKRVLAEYGLLQRFRQVASGFVDTYLLSKLLYSNLSSYSLEQLAKHFLHQMFSAHNAVEDSKILQKLFYTWNPTVHHINRCTEAI